MEWRNGDSLASDWEYEAFFLLGIPEHTVTSVKRGWVCLWLSSLKDCFSPFPAVSPYMLEMPIGYCEMAREKKYPPAFLFSVWEQNEAQRRWSSVFIPRVLFSVLALLLLFVTFLKWGSSSRVFQAEKARFVDPELVIRRWFHCVEGSCGCGPHMAIANGMTSQDCNERVETLTSENVRSSPMLGSLSFRILV